MEDAKIIEKYRNAILKDRTIVRCKECNTKMFRGDYSWYGCPICQCMNGIIIVGGKA
jgi:Zn finger protein HypA/HybF involved in hydrogenase expression